MANTPATTGKTIDALLQERAQYEQWLARLDATDKAPAAVRERVRGDYESRLSGVIDELRGHSATIAEELAHYRGEESRLNGERAMAEETLAEAEIRHMVGEYGDAEWDRLSGESQRQLDTLRSELSEVGAEIARLAEVQTLIEAPSRGAERRGAPPVSVAPTPAAVAAPPAASPSPAAASVSASPSAPAAASAPSAPAATGRQTPVSNLPSPQVTMPLDIETIPTGMREPILPEPDLDEMEFLRSVAGEVSKPAATAPAPSTPPAPTTAPAPTRRSTGAGTATKTVTAEPPPAMGAIGKTAGMAKTLKCGECGTLNRPTEWYCERCGAELAAL